MKKYVMPLIAVILTACSSSTRITGSWKDPDAAAQVKNYKSVFIASFSRNMEVRTKLENALAAEAEKRNIKAVKSTSWFKPDFYEKPPGREELLSRIREAGTDGILTVSLINKESETRYVPGSARYAPMPAFGWYRGFYSYYNYWRPVFYDPGYYVTDKTYFLETNLYDAASENLIWSAQSETVNPGGIDNFVKDYPQKLVEQMVADGILQQ
jgi:hypothetical protein